MLNVSRDNFIICGIDPGTRFCGVCFLNIDFNYNIIDININTLNPENNPLFNIGQNAHDEITNRLFNIHNVLLKYFKYYSPISISVESPFYNRLRPGAYGPLVEAMHVVKNAAFTFNKNTNFRLYSPSIIKLAIGSNYKASKDEVKESILNLKELNKEYKELLNSGNEHEIDSFAVAYTNLKNIKETEGALLCP